MEKALFACDEITGLIIAVALVRPSRSLSDLAVKSVKKKARSKAHPMSQSVKRFKRKMKGYGSFPRPNPKGDGKPTKKVDLRFECKECKKSSTKKGFRSKKFELANKTGA